MFRKATSGYWRIAKMHRPEFWRAPAHYEYGIRDTDELFLFVCSSVCLSVCYTSMWCENDYTHNEAVNAICVYSVWTRAFWFQSICWNSIGVKSK